MAKNKIPMTPAVRQLKAGKAKFIPRLYQYEDRGGTKTASRELGLDEHATIKTLVMEDQSGNPLVVLMHGDKEVSTKALARELGLKSISPCSPQDATRHTGYQVGGTSPFGTKKKLPIYVEASVLDLEVIYINGGKRGFLVEMPASELVRLLNPKPVNAAQAD